MNDDLFDQEDGLLIESVHEDEFDEIHNDEDD